MSNIFTLKKAGLIHGGKTFLKDINVSLNSGEFYYLTGVSGSGKSSLLSWLYGVNSPDTGSLELWGRDSETYSREEKSELRRRMGIVFQDYRLFNHLSIYKNIALPMEIMGKDKRKIKKVVDGLLGWMDLSHTAKMNPYQLSGGQQQQISFARALINRPKLLIADEPTGNIDDISAKKFMRLLSNLNKEGMSIVLATHNLHLIKENPYPIWHLHNKTLERCADYQELNDRLKDGPRKKANWIESKNV
ncbi:MAG: ATP-binding cassette domain-containing protein [Alphaproteobacteria bacterium]|nr:ATP-binding cassette domain-containing protein [Alphaproteobacteria bacterium]MBL0717842.1 ATP-binding cassette domain-containing protein [Alphaproteobacteria bacterium]